jgi:hypothetical protein
MKACFSRVRGYATRGKMVSDGNGNSCDTQPGLPLSKIFIFFKELPIGREGVNLCQ